MTTVAAEGPIFRWAIDGSAIGVAGTARELSRESGGTILARAANGSVSARPGSASGTGSGWSALARVEAADGAAWFLGTESANADQRIYRWASNASATEVGGQGVAIARQTDGSVIVRDSSRVPYHRVGSASSVGTTWNALPYAVTADNATWFVSTEAVGQNRAIYRWAGTNAPVNTTGVGLSVLVSPNGEVRSTTSNGQVYQAIGSGSAFSSNWVALTESLTVTTTVDEDDFSSSSNLGAGTSLREALAYAHSFGTPTTVFFAPALAGQTIALTRDGGDDSALRITGNIGIEGPAGGVRLTIPSGVQRRHLFITAGGSLLASNLTFADGQVTSSGGSIQNFGSLTLGNVSFTSNRAESGSGGAIDNIGTALINNATFTSNIGGEGGAIQNTGTLNISASTFSGNHSHFNGGALRLFGTTTIDRSTFEGNTAFNEGAALITFGNLTVTNSTFASNGKNAVLLWDGSANLDHVTIAYNTNGGLLRVNANATLRNSIVAGNSSFDQGGTLAAGSSNNLLNVSAADARLGSLANNGGPTKTIELLPGSPAINAGLARSANDQRGVSRPQGSASDLGAFERVATSATVQTATFESVTRQALTYTFNGEASVTFDRGSITLTNLTTNQVVNAGMLNWNTDGTRATLVLTNQLADGSYSATTSGATGTTQVDFHVLGGDFNRNRTANFDDLLILAANYNNQTGRDNTQGDANYDGAVNFDDLLILAANYNRTLATVGASLLVAPPGPGASASGSDDEGRDGRGDSVLA